jgi:GNAT superfamily N-acetyltransferase
MPKFHDLRAHLNIHPGVRPLGRGFSMATFTSPALLDQDAKTRIYATLVEVSTQAFGADMTPYWRDRARDGYLDQITRFYFVVDAADEISGWTGYHRFQFEGETCLFLDSTGVLPRYQRSGVMSRLYTRLLTTEFLGNTLRPIHLSMRTESPVVYHTFFRGLGSANIYPSPDREVPVQLQRIGSKLAAWLGQAAKLEPTRLLIRSAYDNLEALYGELPVCADERINAYFRSHLRPEDAFIVIARFDLGTLARVAARSCAGVLRARVAWLAGSP